MSETGVKNAMDKGCDIIIPTYNGSGHIPRLLGSIARQKYRNFQCFVIDDNSGDDTVNLIRLKFPWVHLIEQSENKGPAHNRNIAIRSGKNPYIILFDDDTYLQDSDWLEKAMVIMENNPQMGQLATMIVSGFDPEVLLDCGIIQRGYIFGGLFHNQNRQQVGEQYLKARRVLGVCSAGTILRRDVFNLIGGFDSRYFYPAEDLDVSLRIHLAGFDIRYEPTLVVFHYESQAMGKSLSRKMYMYRRNCLLALLENYPSFYIGKMLAAMLGREIVIPFCRYCFTCLKKRQKDQLPGSFKDYLRATWFVLLSSQAILKKRRRVDCFKKRPRKYLLTVNREICE